MAERTLRAQRKKSLIVIFSLACYAALAAYQLSLPGLEYDEVFYGPAALGCTTDFQTPALLSENVALTSRFSPLAFSAFSLSIGSSSFPVMLMPYWGALKAHLMAPLFSFWGVSPHTIRLPALLVGFCALLFFYLFFAGVFSPLVGVIATVLLASDPSYIFYTRHDFGSAALSLFLVSCPLWCLARWVQTERVSWLGVAFFLFGVGVYNRLDYVAFLAALGATMMVCWRKLPWRRVGRKEIVIMGVSFLLGCAPFLLFVSLRPSLAASSLSLAAPVQDFSASTRLKGYVLWTVLNGTSLYDFFSARSGIHVGKEVAPDGETRIGSYVVGKQTLAADSLASGTLTPYFVLFLAGILCFLHPPPALKVLSVFLGFLLLCLCGIAGAVRGHHFVIVLPFVQAFLASSLVLIGEKINTGWMRVAPFAVGILLVGTNLSMNFRYHRFLAETGGRGVWSEAIYDLAQYLQVHCGEKQRCFLGDWGMGTQVVTLARGKLAVEEIFWPYLQDGDERSLEVLIRIDSALFVFYTNPYVNFSRPKRLFYATAQRIGHQVVVERIFTERDGTPVLAVVRVEENQ